VLRLLSGYIMKTVKFITLGCKVNQFDTQSIRERFLGAGYSEIDNGKPADIYLINTCTVTHRADSDSLNLIRKAKRENSRAKIIVTGCLTELDEDLIRQAAAKVIIVKNKDKEKLPSQGLTPKYNSRRAVLRGLSLRANSISYFKGHTRAFLKIQDGCDNFCSYCKVPLVRGRSRSRGLDKIVSDARQLVKNGFKEIVLCGICLGSYGKGLSSGKNLVDVIEALEKIDGLLRIRLSSIEAGDVSDKLIAKMAGSEKLCPHLHIPIQSGDDDILKKMNRRYSRKDYLALIKRIKKNIPEVAITTDVLVGFPGESECNFQNTLKLIKEILPLKVHIFPYSPRKGTLASAKFNQRIDPGIIKERIARLKDVAGSCSLEYKKQFLNRNMQVLVEGRSKENPAFWQGHTGNFLEVLIRLDLNLSNKIVTTKLRKLKDDFVLAEIFH